MDFLKGLQQPQKPTNASTGCFGASTLVTLLAFWETLIQLTVEHSETWRFRLSELYLARASQPSQVESASYEDTTSVLCRDAACD